MVGQAVYSKAAGEVIRQKLGDDLTMIVLESGEEKDFLHELLVPEKLFTRQRKNLRNIQEDRNMWMRTKKTLLQSKLPKL